jgi:hypothetical protein
MVHVLRSMERQRLHTMIATWCSVVERWLHESTLRGLRTVLVAGRRLLFSRIPETVLPVMIKHVQRQWLRLCL